MSNEESKQISIGGNILSIERGIATVYEKDNVESLSLITLVSGDRNITVGKLRELINNELASKGISREINSSEIIEVTDKFNISINNDEMKLKFVCEDQVVDFIASLNMMILNKKFKIEKWGQRMYQRDFKFEDHIPTQETEDEEPPHQDEEH